MKNNNIKTIELTRKIREKQYDEIKNKNRSEIINYFKNILSLKEWGC